ncbi:UNVERIFIED_CONTAM: protein Brevis radix-like 2 [Sesamum radiatum]|uniref:Protein Brevis radix-like 2 n=1 Tax=Sesamum radiatum TaxID=300843 RepID=A0AAW2PFQ9_SESRA
MELYNVQRFNRNAVPLPSPPRSEDENSKLESAEGSPETPPLSKEHIPRHFIAQQGSLIHQTHSNTSHNLVNTMSQVVSTPKLSNMSAAKTETSIDASARVLLDHSGELLQF